MDFAAGPMDLSQDTVMAHVQAAASAVTAYYGRFPVARARVLIVPVADREGIVQGTTWGDMAAFRDSRASASVSTPRRMISPTTG